jgi:protein TonB
MTLAWSAETNALPGAEPASSGLGRWTASLLAVALVHALGALALLSWRTPVVPIVAPPAAVLIDLAPLPLPAVEPPTPREPEPIPEIVPKPVVVPPRPAVVLPQPKPKPVPRHVDSPPPPQPEAAPAPPRPPAPPAPAAPVAAPSAPAPVAVAPSYQGLLLAQLERNKRYPREARLRRQEGVATLRFSIDRTGKLIAFKLEHGSGVAALDEEVLAMIQRAAPLPAFPPEMTQAQLELVVPIRFSLR